MFCKQLGLFFGLSLALSVGCGEHPDLEGYEDASDEDSSQDISPADVAPASPPSEPPSASTIGVNPDTVDLRGCLLRRTPCDASEELEGEELLPSVVDLDPSQRFVGDIAGYDGALAE